ADTRAVPPRLAELRRTLPAVAVECGPLREEAFRGVDLVAISPGLPLSEPLVRRAAGAGIPVVGDIELFAQAVSGRTARMVAVTGTNGKSTVTALAGAMARAAGADCEVAGNIGPPALEALMRREDAGRPAEAWVLELSSFQLETTRSLAADAATVLNVTEDHLDRYSGIEDYARAKARIFSGEGVQVLNRDDRRSLSMALPGRKSITFGLEAAGRTQDWGVVAREREPWLAQGENAILPARELRLAGRHNVANALAALALCGALRLPLPPQVAALRAFKGLPHRVEPVGEAGGVSWFDDSKGTNVGSTVAALAGLAREGSKVVLIAGGEGKGQDFSPLKDALARSARALVLIGRDAPLIEAAVAGAGIPVRRASSMEEAVFLAAQAARPGDAVLLSPACASFDMFRDYRHRGDVFRAAVEKVTDAASH
ncbi:MAG: UDP-N-acetylmuramoyl-L-alanine--D-glutamate ligase, partial [Burkholderiales bacterium]